MKCSKCGGIIDENYGICKECGARNFSDGEKRGNKHVYKEFIEDYKKNNIVELILNICTLLLLCVYIFIPIFTARIENIELFPNLVLTGTQEVNFFLNGYVDINFSIFDDFMNIVNYFKAAGDYGLEEAMSLLDCLFNPMIIIMSVILFICNIVNIFKISSNLINLDDSTLLMYNEIAKTGTKKTKESFMKKQTFFSLVLYFIFDIAFIYVMKGFYDMFDNVCQRYLNYINGVSNLFYLFILLFVIYLILYCVFRRMSKKIKLRIVRKEIDN